MNEISAHFFAYTLGGFSLERKLANGVSEPVSLAMPGPVTYEKNTESLLGYLLCARESTALRSTIMRELWNPDLASVDTYMYRATSGVIRALGEEPYFKRTLNKQKYALADQSLIWNDAQHCEELMEAARRVGPSTDQGVAYLQEARYHLSRGLFLPEETGAWVHTRRSQMQTLTSDCMNSLLEAYTIRGKDKHAHGGEAWDEYKLLEETAEQVLRTDPLNATALYYLMIALDKRWMGHEALRRYREISALARKQGSPLSSEVHQLAHRLEQKRQYRPIRLSTFASSDQMTSSPSQSVNLQGIIHGEANTEEILKKPTVVDTACESSGTVSLLKAGSLLCQEQLVICKQQQKYVQDQIQRGNMMSDEANKLTDTNQITRRDLIELAFVAAPVLTNMQRERPRPFMIEEFLSEATTSITACWHLQGNSLTLVERAISQYLPLLEELVQHFSLHRQRAAYLAAQVFLLLDSVAYHHLCFADGIGYCEQAVEYARESGDLTLLLVSLEELGSALRAHGPENRMIEIYEQAEKYSNDTGLSGILRSKVRSGLGLASAQRGKSEEVTRFLNEARALFIEDNTELPVFLVGCHSLLDIILSEGRGDLALGDIELQKENTSDALTYYKGATEKLAQIEQLSSGMIVPQWDRVKIDNYRSLAYAKLRNLTEFEKYFIRGANGAKSLESKKREQEVWDNLIFALHQWPHETRVTDLLSLLR